MHKCENIERKITIDILREIREDIMSLKCEQDAIIKGPLRKNPQKYLQPTNPTVLFSFGGAHYAMASNSSLLSGVCSLLPVSVSLWDLGNKPFQWTFMPDCMLSQI